MTASGSCPLLLDLAARPIIAHRGASANAPENTLPAFALALEHGAEALEFDVRLTADGVPVVMHDPTGERTTTYQGLVRQAAAADLKQADAGAWFTPDGGASFPWRNQGVTVPTLAEVLDAFPEIPLLIELKEVDGQQRIRAMLERSASAHRCVIAASDGRALRCFRGGPFALGASRRDILRVYAAAWLGRPLRDPGFQVLSVPERYRGLRVPSGRFVAMARRSGCPVHVWTVDDEAAALALWKLGVSGIVTNVPGRLRRLRDTLNPLTSS